MSTKTALIPADVKVAAKRGFIRSTYQALAATIPTGGVSAAAIASLIRDPDPVLFVATGVAALLTPVLAGLASYFSITSNGIPGDYAPETTETGQVLVTGGGTVDPSNAVSR